MAPTQKWPHDHTNPTPHDPDDERRRREEKRRREDDDIAEADARLEKDERRRRREKLRAWRAAEDARVRAAVAEYVAAGRGETAREVEPKGPAREVACLGCVQRATLSATSGWLRTPALAGNASSGMCAAGTAQVRGDDQLVLDNGLAPQSSRYIALDGARQGRLRRFLRGPRRGRGRD
ncbi:hypothetical protein PTI98_007983 [Pleurotus ostreatus]|nr:hypothetical protein PTI98_007983 [Pleurotus ostreatus]